MDPAKRRVLGKVDVVSPTPQRQNPFECPVCNEAMLTLEQLNRHLDDSHFSQNPIENEQDDARGWLKSQINRSQSRKIVNLDLLDGNRFTLHDSTGTSPPNPTPIPRKHWQKPRGDDKCNHDKCRRRLGIKNGVVNCRKCGLLFCNMHTLYDVKLDSELQYNPRSGSWARCCRKCYLNKPELAIPQARTRDLSQEFENHRSLKLEAKQLEAAKVENRLDKFILYFQDPKRIPMKSFQQSVVLWRSDHEVDFCPRCKTPFGFSPKKLQLERKHHCRLCGDVFCGDGCSMEVPISMLSAFLGKECSAEGALRICYSCKHLLYNKRLFEKDVCSEPSETLRIDEQMVQLQKKINSFLPEFKKTMSNLQSTPQDIEKAAMGRKRLMGYFSKLDKLTKRIDALNQSFAGSKDELKVMKSIHQIALTFLQENMVSLKSVPRMASPSEPLKKSKKEVREMRETLMVLREQSFLLDDMIEKSKRGRKFDDMKSLEVSKSDLEGEIERLTTALGDEGF